MHGCGFGTFAALKFDGAELKRDDGGGGLHSGDKLPQNGGKTYAIAMNLMSWRVVIRWNVRTQMIYTHAPADPGKLFLCEAGMKVSPSRSPRPISCRLAASSHFRITAESHTARREAS